MPFAVFNRELISRAFDYTGLNHLLLQTGSWSGLLVLNYHRIGEAAASDLDRDLFSASADAFAKQVRYLAKNFDVVNFDDLEEVLGQTSGQYVMITFDDGYRDNYDIAFPILQQENATANFFLATGFLDKQTIAWWDNIAWMVNHSSVNEIPANDFLDDPVCWSDESGAEAIRQLLNAYKKLHTQETQPFLDFLAHATQSGHCPSERGADLWMTWDMVREMRNCGMAFGGHTVNHPVLSRTAKADQDREISGCKQRIEAELQETINCFSYPVGGTTAFTKETEQSVLENGYRWGFSYYGGYSQFGHVNPLDIPRTPVEPCTTSPQFHTTMTIPQLFA